MAFINRHNIENTLTLSDRVVALLPFSSDEHKCYRANLPVIHDLHNFNWYITNVSSVKDLGLDDKGTKAFMYKDGDISSLRTFIQSSNNLDLLRICIDVKELKKRCLL